jgi:succinate-acetate transporter protein
MSGGGKGLANPAPAGLVALAVACFIYFASMTGRVDGGAIPLMGCWLVGGFVVQIVVGIIEILEGNTTGANVFTFFCGFFMLVGGLEMFVKFWASINQVPLDAHVDGWAWLALTSSLVLWTPAYLKESNAVMGSCVIAIDVAIIFITLMDIGLLGAQFKPLAGWFLFIAGALGIYVASAIILNTAYKKPLLPLPGPFIK